MIKKRILWLASLVLMTTSTPAPAGEATTLKEIMQGLRDSLVEVSDGLLTDDFELAARGAMGIAEHPRIPAEQVQLVAQELEAEMASFKQLDTLVHDLALEINAAAKSLDRNAAVSGYERIIKTRLICHEAYKERVSGVLANP